MSNGHLVGSELLSSVGRRLQQLSRKQDWCFRYGGDEFVILMPETDAQNAFDLARDLLASLMETQFQMKNGLELTVRASVGLATSPDDGSAVHSIIGTADSRMYFVKTNGRGKVWGA